MLHRLSPYHNIDHRGCYPPTMVTVGEADEVAVPMHGYKYIAARQAVPGCAQPALLKVVRGGGHGYGTTPAQVSQTMADQLAFLVKVLGINKKDAPTAKSKTGH